MVVRKADGLLTATIPQRLPNFGPLAEVIVDRPIWVRTADGVLYPAPKDSYWGLSGLSGLRTWVAGIADLSSTG